MLLYKYFYIHFNAKEEHSLSSRINCQRPNSVLGLNSMVQLPISTTIITFLNRPHLFNVKFVF